MDYYSLMKPDEFKAMPARLAEMNAFITVISIWIPMQQAKRNKNKSD